MKPSPSRCCGRSDAPRPSLICHDISTEALLPTHAATSTPPPSDKPLPPPPPPLPHRSDLQKDKQLNDWKIDVRIANREARNAESALTTLRESESSWAAERTELTQRGSRLELQLAERQTELERAKRDVERAGGEANELKAAHEVSRGGGGRGGRVGGVVWDGRVLVGVGSGERCCESGEDVFVSAGGGRFRRWVP